MKKLYVFLLSIFLVFSASGTWADTIDRVAISEGPPVIVEITGTFACDGARAPFTLQTSVENKIMIQIFTNPPQPECTESNVQFTLQEKITPPAHGGYEVDVFLYSGIPGDDAQVVLQDYEKIIVKEAITAMVDINPNTINLKRNGQLIGAKIKMLEGYDPANIVVESIKLYIVKDNDELSEGIPAQRAKADMFDDALNVKFSNQAVLNLIKANASEFPATVKFLVQWQTQGDDTIYEGPDEVQVINPGKTKDKDKGQGNNNDDKRGKGSGKGEK